MTTTAIRTSAVPHARLSSLGLLRSEFTKLRSLRSTVWSYVAALLLLIGVSGLICAAEANDWQRHPGGRGQFDATFTSISGAFLAQLAVGVLGVLLISGEYSTGMIRSTMAAVPRRLPALWAKLAVFVAVTFVAMEAATFVAFGLGQSILHSTGASVGLGTPEVMRALVGSGLYLTTVGVLGMGLGALLRHTAGAISLLVGVLLVLPIIVQFLPQDMRRAVSKFLPGEAGHQVLTVLRDPDSLGPWAGYALFLGYAVAVIVVAAVLLKRRDV